MYKYCYVIQMKAPFMQRVYSPPYNKTKYSGPGCSKPDYANPGLARILISFL